MKRILFVCIANSGRSQIAEAFTNHYGKYLTQVSSAGTMPAERVDPIIIEVMKEIGIDISKKQPKLLTPKMIEESDLVTTMGCSVENICPAQFSKNIEDWKIEDPKGKPIEKIRKIRDEIEKRVKKLLSEITVNSL